MTLAVAGVGAGAGRLAVPLFCRIWSGTGRGEGRRSGTQHEKKVGYAAPRPERGDGVDGTCPFLEQRPHQRPLPLEAAIVATSGRVDYTATVVTITTTVPINVGAAIAAANLPSYAVFIDETGGPEVAYKYSSCNLQNPPSSVAFESSTRSAVDLGLISWPSGSTPTCELNRHPSLPPPTLAPPPLPLKLLPALPQPLQPLTSSRTTLPIP